MADPYMADTIMLDADEGNASSDSQAKTSHEELLEDLNNDIKMTAIISSESFELINQDDKTVSDAAGFLRTASRAITETMNLYAPFGDDTDLRHSWRLIATCGTGVVAASRYALLISDKSPGYSTVAMWAQALCQDMGKVHMRLSEAQVRRVQELLPPKEDTSEGDEEGESSEIAVKIEPSSPDMDAVPWAPAVPPSSRPRQPGSSTALGSGDPAVTTPAPAPSSQSQAPASSAGALPRLLAERAQRLYEASIRGATQSSSAASGSSRVRVRGIFRPPQLPPPPPEEECDGLPRL